MTNAIDYLWRGLQDRSSRVRAVAFEQICSLPQRWEFLSNLIGAAAREIREWGEKEGVFEEMVLSLTDNFGSSIIPELELIINAESVDTYEKIVATAVLAKIVKPHSTQVLIGALRSSQDVVVRKAATKALLEQCGHAISVVRYS